MARSAVWKFVLEKSGVPEEVFMPVGARVLSAGVVPSESTDPGAFSDDVVIWVLVDPDADRESRRFACFTTGAPVVPDDAVFIGTVQVPLRQLGGVEVLHVWALT